MERARAPQAGWCCAGDEGTGKPPSPALPGQVGGSPPALTPSTSRDNAHRRSDTPPPATALPRGARTGYVTTPLPRKRRR